MGRFLVSTEAPPDGQEARRRAEERSLCSGWSPFGFRRLAASALSRAGFTLVELGITVALIATLAALVIPQISSAREQLRLTQAITDILTIQDQITIYVNDFGTVPDTLEQAGITNPLDPWGRPYRFLNIAGGGPGVHGHSRKDHSMVPVNSDYDLYSMGPDGDSKPPFTARASRDDIVRAGNGGYIGTVADF